MFIAMMGETANRVRTNKKPDIRPLILYDDVFLLKYEQETEELHQWNVE
jgi:hypothetical protein